ncbi:MAG: peptide ABC transporter substrate-binding protein [Proteobacteria bacterium]|nr:peptide ABC transporter substrate-binding protein [Pseudomonadota bacterium]
MKNLHWLKLKNHSNQRRRFLRNSSLLAAASTLPFSAANAYADGSTLRVRSYSDMQSLDPAFSSGVVDEEIQGPIYNKLVQYKPGREWGWQLDAAQMVKQVSDTRIDFALRDDIGFSNGFGAMTAEDVKFSFERIISSDLKSSNKPDMGSLSHVEVTGERTGTVVLSEPFAPLWSIALPYITGNIVSKKAVEKADGGRIGTDPLAESGPYRRHEWKPKEKTVLKRNPDWRGPAPAFDTIEIYPIDDEKIAEIAFEANELDYTRVSIDSVQRYRNNPPAGATLAEYPSLFYVWIGMNLDNAQLQNKKLRQAIQYVIDIPSILEGAYHGVATASTGIIAPGLAGHRAKSIVPPEANIEKAQQLLADSGERNVSLTLDVINKSVYTTIAQIVQANLQQIGINLEINVHEAGSFWSLGDESKGEQWKNVQLILNRFSMTPDPYYATSWFTQEQVGVWNWERFRSQEFDDLHKKAAQEFDVAKRDAMYQRAQDLLEESGAYRFITHEATPVVYSNTIRPAFRPDGLPLFRYFKRA